MSLYVTNLDTREEMAMLADEHLSIARLLADRMQEEVGGHWVVQDKRKKGEVLYDASKAEPFV